jgi:NADH-quinone oxidoreductase subunit K
MGIEIMLLSVDLNLATFSVYLSDSLGQIYFLLGLTVAAAESAIGLAILIAYFKKRKKIAILEINSLKG